jgi:hypothetical protein
MPRARTSAPTLAYQVLVTLQRIEPTVILSRLACTYSILT